MIQNYINHIVFVVDKSGSMMHLSSEVVKVFDSQIKYLSQRSQELNQETRVSVYLFNEKTQCIVYDMDVMRLPSLKTHYSTGGQTALIDGTIKAIDDLEKTAQLYGDHAFLVYVLTDGEENASKSSIYQIKTAINNQPENWTMAVLVPDQRSVFEAKKLGFPPDNIQVWSAVQGGVEKAGESIRIATDSYLRARASGVRGTKSLFKLDSSVLTKQAVATNLEELKPSEYDVLIVRQDGPIKEFVTGWLGSYRVGSSYYQLSKPEKIQSYKEVVVQDRRNGKTYTGDNARQMLGLPDYELKVEPGTTQ